MKKKTQLVIYRTGLGDELRAAVRTRHRDGDLAVEPWFYVDEQGEDTGAFQGGFKLRIGAEHVIQAAPTASAV